MSTVGTAFPLIFYRRFFRYLPPCYATCLRADDHCRSARCYTVNALHIFAAFDARAAKGAYIFHSDIDIFFQDIMLRAMPARSYFSFDA